MIYKRIRYYHLMAHAFRWQWAQSPIGRCHRSTRFGGFPQLIWKIIHDKLSIGFDKETYR